MDRRGTNDCWILNRCLKKAASENESWKNSGRKWHEIDESGVNEYCMNVVFYMKATKNLGLNECLTKTWRKLKQFVWMLHESWANEG